MEYYQYYLSYATPDFIIIVGSETPITVEITSGSDGCLITAG